MKAKRITRFKFSSGGPIKIAVINQFGERYEIDASINVRRLVDTGQRDDAGRPIMEVHLAVSYASYPAVEPIPTAPIGELRQVDFIPIYPGPARVTFRDQENRDAAIEVTPIVVRVDDIGSRDTMNRTQFGIHVSCHYDHVNFDKITAEQIPSMKDASIMGGGG